MKISDIIKASGNEFAAVAEEGVTAGDVTSWVDSGSYALNALLSGTIYGGFPGNKIVVIGAEPSTGKTFFALGAAKHFLDENPEGMVCYFESESAISKEMLVERGIDVSRLAIIPVSTVQEFKTQALKIVDEYESQGGAKSGPMLFVMDSLGMLTTNKELADSTSGNDTRDMTRAQVLKSAFRVLTLRLGKAQVPMIVTNHVYQSIGGGLYAQKVQAGGTGAVYASSIILTLTKAKEKDSDGQVTGVVVSVTASKSRLTRENTKVKCLIKFQGGLDRYYGLVELGEKAGVLVKEGTRYKLPDGSKAFGKTILENPEKYFTKEVLDGIDEWVKQNFRYIS